MGHFGHLGPSPTIMYRSKYPSIVENLARHAGETPERLCLADENKALNYKEVWTSVYGLSRELGRRGVNDGSCVIIESDQSADFMVYEFAIQLAGGVFVPLERNAAVPRVVEIGSDCEAVLYVGKKALLEQADASELGGVADVPFMPIEDACKFAEEVNIDEVCFPAASDVAEILFSTGTTGKSKGIVLTHGNDVAIAENVINGVKMKPDNVEMIPMPTSHSHGLRRSYGNIANGSSVVYLSKITLLKKMFNMMREYGVTSIDLSPSMLSIIFKLSKDAIGEFCDVMDYVQLGSAPLPEEDKQHLSRLLPKTRLYNFYGTTEAGCSCILDFNEVQGKPGCIGKPAVNAVFKVVDEEHNEIESSPENLGFLASAGAINMKEYFKAPELTKEAMPEGDYIYTKDLGYIDADGFVYMLGRKDDVINFAGIKISPEEVEALVVKNDMIKDCALIPVDDALTGQAPKLYIVIADGQEYDAKAFKIFLSEVIDANKQPKYIELIDEIPRTFNGKIIRKELIALNK